MRDQVTGSIDATSPAAIFVYGTLQRGQVRERCWPRQPVAIESATVRGALYDLGPYPALVPGNDTVGGELWHIAPADMAVTLAALDHVEGYAGRPDDLYRRVIVECQTASAKVPAWTYRLAQTELLQSARHIAPAERGVCTWAAAQMDRPK
jgi:gamma-glutamylcyclotransferase (GGCT)/AIG2-like uncharacterized protein YtfP